ncbi:MAG: hypothetical protein H6604_02275 [Flavobacteriales bacterium]|nr:hypothetical protein [Flavobacteriales bacterium]
MRKKTFISTLCLLIGVIAYSQSLGEFTPKDKKLGKDLKSKTKEVYIANFSVNYQIFNQKEKSVKGGLIGRGIGGNTKAELTVGLNNVEYSDLQKVTNEVYQKFVTDLKSQGFTIINADQAGKTDYFSKYTRVDNMEPSLAEGPGLLTVYPQGQPFFIEGFYNSGEKKQGGLLGKISKIGGEDVNRLKAIASYNKLSSQLNDAAIINVDLYVMFLEVEKSYQGGGAKIVANTNYRLSAYEHLKGKNDRPTSKVGSIIGKASEITVLCESRFDVVQGKNKIGGSPLFQYTGGMKKNLEIDGVIKKESFKSFAQQDIDVVGTETAFGKLYRAEGKSSESIAIIDVNKNAYLDGAKQSLEKFMDYHTSEFTK